MRGHGRKGLLMRMTARWTVLGIVLVLLDLGTASAQSGLATGQDPVAGAQVFAAKGCSKCHAINGVGGKVGPDLAKISKPHTFYDLATAMWNHLPKMAGKMKELGIERPQLDSRE